MSSSPRSDKTTDTGPRGAGLGLAAEALGARLPALLVAAQRVAETVSPGEHGRRRVGLGESFWQFRPYQTGDTVDGIDWRQSAKGDRLYIRETEWSAAQTVFLWRDTAPGMNYSSHRALPTKQQRADLLLMGLASLLSRGGERIALLDGNREPNTGKGAVHAILDGLRNELSLPAIGRLVPRHSTLVLFSDFLDPVEEIAQALDRIAPAGVAAQLVQILDPAEANLSFSGRIRFREMSEDAPSDTDALIPRVEAIRPAYLEALLRQQEALGALARTRGWEFLTHTTDQAAEEPLRVLYSRLASRRSDAGDARR